MNVENTIPEKDPIAGPILFTAVAVASAFFFWWFVTGTLPGAVTSVIILAIAAFLWWVLRR